MLHLLQIKTEIQNGLHTLLKGNCAETCYHKDARLWGSHPFNELHGVDQINNLWEILLKCFPDMERRDSIFVGGYNLSDERNQRDITGQLMIASICHYQGTFRESLFGIPPTHGVIHLRSSEAHTIVDGKIVHSYMLFDFLDLMRQAGCWPLVPSLGSEGFWMAPAIMNGVTEDFNGALAGNEAIKLVLRMHAALHEFDGNDIESMPMDEYWTENFQYYAASGIGTTRGLKGFRAHHQIPFLTGFPDRKGHSHYIRIGDGNIAVTGGWPSVGGTHLGEWLGLPPTGKYITMRVMDFYRINNGRIAENWVPIDIIHCLLQMGFDVFSRLKHLQGKPKLYL